MRRALAVLGVAVVRVRAHDEGAGAELGEVAREEAGVRPAGVRGETLGAAAAAASAPQTEHSSCPLWLISRN